MQSGSATRTSFPAGGVKIDERELKSIDLKSLNGGASPYPAGDLSLERTFARPIDFYRRTVAEVVGATGGRVLDLLCGVGRWSIFLAEQNEEVVGIDRLEGCVAIARGLCRRLGINNAQFHAQDVSYIKSLPSGSFDTVWMFSALQYVERRFTLQQAQRVLKPGGILFVGNYNSDGIMLSHLLSGVEAHSWNQGASQWALGALARGEQADGNPSFITVAGAAEMCGRFGFELAVIKPDREFYPYDVEAHGRESHGRGPDTTSSRAQFLQGYVSAVSLVARKERGWRTAGRRLSAAPFRSRLKRLARRVLRGR